MLYNSDFSREGEEAVGPVGGPFAGPIEAEVIHIRLLELASNRGSQVFIDLALLSDCTASVP